MSFEANLKSGRVGENAISRWLQAKKGACVFPAYEKELLGGKGPQLFRRAGNLVLPDMFVFTARGQFWVEAKTKSHFTWHRNTGRWTTGVDMRHYKEYIQVEESTATPVWLMFFHPCENPSNADIAYHCPPIAPVGLFGHRLAVLRGCVNHESPPKNTNRPGLVGHGASGMVYWSHNSLRLLASVDEVQESIIEAPPRRPLDTPYPTSLD